MQNIENQTIIVEKKEKEQKAVLPLVFKQYAIVGTVAGSLILIYGLISLLMFRLYGSSVESGGFVNYIKNMFVNTYNRSGFYTPILGMVTLTGSLVLFNLSKVTGQFIKFDKKRFFEFIKPLNKIKTVYMLLMFEALFFVILSFYSGAYLMLVLFLLISFFFMYIKKKIANIISGIYLINKKIEPKPKRKIRFW